MMTAFLSALPTAALMLAFGIVLTLVVFVLAYLFRFKLPVWLVDFLSFFDGVVSIVGVTHPFVMAFAAVVGGGVLGFLLTICFIILVVKLCAPAGDLVRTFVARMLERVSQRALGSSEVEPEGIDGLLARLDTQEGQYNDLLGSWNQMQTNGVSSRKLAGKGPKMIQRLIQLQKSVCETMNALNPIGTDEQISAASRLRRAVIELSVLIEETMAKSERSARDMGGAQPSVS